MKIRNYVIKILITLILFPSILFGNNFPHIRTWGYDLWDLSLDLEQAKWLAKRQDYIFGGMGNTPSLSESLYDAMKEANPEVKFIPYIAYNTYELAVQNWIKNWCEQKGYDFEDTFYHYYYDTEVKLRDAPYKVLIKGYGGGTAKTIKESRVPSSWASYNFGINQVTGEINRFNINPTSKVWRLAYQAYILEKRIKVNASKGKYADGIELDTFDGTVYDMFDLQLERTIEMRKLGKLTRSEANRQASNDLIAAMHELRTYLTNQVGRPIITVPNTGDVDSFYEWRKFLYEDRLSDYSHVMMEYIIQAGSNVAKIRRLKQIYDTMVNAGLTIFARNETSILDISEKVNQFLIAGHYLINHPNYIVMYHRGNPRFYGGNPAGQLYTTHWHKNLEYDIGKPLKRSSQDYWGDTNTDRFFVFASDSTYKILGREYTKALVLTKFGAEGSVYNAGKNPTTHNLNGTYRLLQPDNTLGPPITEITLGYSEGAILIKDKQTILPAPAPTITLTPSTDPTPVVEHTTTPITEPTSTPVIKTRPTKLKSHAWGRNKRLSTLRMFSAVAYVDVDGSPVGNLKSYEITANSTNIYSGVQILDSTKTPALDSKGLIKDTSRSYWSPEVDGKQVDKGGLGELLLSRTKPRVILTNIEGGDLMSESNEFTIENGKLTPELLGLSPKDKVAKERLIHYVHGYDSYVTEPGKSELKKRKWILGPIIHSRPLVINYEEHKSVVFVGANDGMLHAFDAISGEELWGFIPFELLSRLKELPQSKGLKYFVDGSPKSYITQSQKILVFGLRRGGSYYYALEVTDPLKPKFLWKVGPETVGFSELGQTWSTPQIGKIKVKGEEKVVCFVGGGYDEGLDKKTLGIEDKKGRAVYAIDLMTGTQVWRWDYERDPNMRYAIPSDISPVDTDGDGYIDRLYVGDTGGRLWRIDIKSGDLKEWSAGVIFNSNPDSSGWRRKVFYRPEVTLERGYEMVFFGTGDQVNPDEMKVVNQIYALKDHGLHSMVTLKDLKNVTKEIADLKEMEEKKGWFLNLENKGEKVLASPVLLFGVLYFTSFTPSRDGSTEGVARIYALDYKTGGPILNLNSANDVEGQSEADWVRLDLSNRSKVIGDGFPSHTVITALDGRLLALTGFSGGVYQTPLKKDKAVIPIWWKQVSKSK